MHKYSESTWNYETDLDAMILKLSLTFVCIIVAEEGPRVETLVSVTSKFSMVFLRFHACKMYCEATT